jgi:hypothetical protein
MLRVQAMAQAGVPSGAIVLRLSAILGEGELNRLVFVQPQETPPAATMTITRAPNLAMFSSCLICLATQRLSIVLAPSMSFHWPPGRLSADRGPRLKPPRGAGTSANGPGPDRYHSPNGFDGRPAGRSPRDERSRQGRSWTARGPGSRTEGPLRTEELHGERRQVRTQ